MSNSKITDLITEFRVRMDEILAEERREAITQLLAGPPPKKPKAVKAPRKPRAPKVQAAPIEVTEASESNGQSGGYLDEMAVLRAVETLPGRGVSALAKELGAPSPVVSALLKKLIKGGTVTTEGHRRATVYHPSTH